MVDRKDIKAREYEGKDLVAFKYVVEVEEDAEVKKFNVYFSKVNSRTWKVVMLDPFDDVTASNFEVMSDMPLELICARGLVMIHSKILDMIEKCQPFLFTVSELVSGM